MYDLTEKIDLESPLDRLIGTMSSMHSIFDYFEILFQDHANNKRDIHGDIIVEKFNEIHRLNGEVSSLKCYFPMYEQKINSAITEINKLLSA